MKLRRWVSLLLLWVSIPLGVASLGFSVFFGIDVVRLWLAPPKAVSAPLAPDAHPIEVVAGGVSKTVDALGGFADGITQMLFTFSTIGLAVAFVLFWIGWRLRRVG